MKKLTPAQIERKFWALKKIGDQRIYHLFVLLPKTRSSMACNQAAAGWFVAEIVLAGSGRNFGGKGRTTNDAMEAAMRSAGVL